MIQGHIDLQRFDARGLTREEIDAGIKAMGLDRFLKEVHKNGHWEGKNRVLAAFARCMYYANGAATNEGGWLNAPNPGDFYNTSSRPLLWGVLLATTSTEPAVNEWWSQNNSYNWTPPDAVTSQYDALKRFNTDGPIDVEVYKDPNGKEGAHVRQKFLWYPGEATSSSIRSVVLYGSEGDSGYGGVYEDKARICRWRIKDSGGNPVTLSKLSQEVLLLQYTFSIYSK